MIIDELLMERCYKYEVLLSPTEISFLHALLNDYIENEENKDKSINIANIINGEINHMLGQIRSEER